MKKIIITTIAGIILATVITGCGKDTEKTSKEEHSNVEEIRIEEIMVEEIQTEEIEVEEIKVEYIDDEYQNELDYNSKVNTWENNNKIIRW
jgi:ABC-type glycerol-3-phosphate transport system substrate-binding protein